MTYKQYSPSLFFCHIIHFTKAFLLKFNISNSKYFINN